MNTPAGLSLYNQDRLDDETFLAGFVARHELAELLLRQLRQLPAEAAAEHQLLVGARGQGKTSLLRRIAIGIERDAALARRYLPLRFREEQYNVRTLAVFWRNCLDALADRCEAKGDSEAASRLDRFLGSDQSRDPEAAAQAFRDELRRLGRRAVLLVDNLDLVLDALSEEENWSLRRFLQEAGGPVLIGAATRHLSQAGDREAPFYEFFFPHLLEPLTEAETLRCLGALAKARGEAGEPVEAILSKEPKRVTALHRLTGGNPRVLVLIYRLLESAETDTVLADLEGLLDEVTPYYKARVEEYATPLQRSVIDAVALHWDPVTTNALSKATGVPVTTLSGQIKRLKDDGLIREVPTSGARSGYELAERFMNIWYLMRHGSRHLRQRVRWLAEFFKSFYLPEELRRLAHRSESEGDGRIWAPFYRHALESALEAGSDSATEFRRSLSRSAKAMPTSKRRAVSAPSASAPPPAGEPTQHEQAARELVEKGLALRESGRVEEAIAAFEAVVERFGASEVPALQEWVASALIDKGRVLGEAGRFEEAIAAYEVVVERFGASEISALQEQVAAALVDKGRAFREVGRFEEAIAAHEVVVERFGASGTPALQEQFAWALVFKALALGEAGRFEEAIAAFDVVVERFGASKVPALQGQVARVLVFKGRAFGEAGRFEEAVTAFEAVVERFGASELLPLQEQVAAALVFKGRTFGEAGRFEEAIAAYEVVVERFGASEMSALQEQVARALGDKGVALGETGQIEEAIATFEMVEERFGASKMPALQRVVARALVNSGVALWKSGRAEESIAACEAVVERFGASEVPALQEAVARALVNRSVALWKPGRTEESIAVCEAVVERFGASKVPALQEAAGQALALKGDMLADGLQDYAAAKEIYLRARRLDGTGQVQVAANLAWVHLATGEPKEAEKLRGDLDDLPAPGLLLLDAAFALIRDNFGEAAGLLQQALGADLSDGGAEFTGDLYRLLRLAEAWGYGEKLVAWFEESGEAERAAPLYAAFLAYVRGRDRLLDFNPEVRSAAVQIHDWLTGERWKGPGREAPAEPKRRRGRRQGSRKTAKR